MSIFSKPLVAYAYVPGAGSKASRGSGGVVVGCPSFDPQAANVATKAAIRQQATRRTIGAPES